jgi:methyltransferase (TIGR00027 family)
MLAKAGIDASRVTFVPADFEQEDWLEKLTAAGFDLEKPSIFTWESVTMYLDPEAVKSTLRKIVGMAPGTALAFDYFSAELLESRSLFMRYARVVIKLTGEPWKFGIDNTPPARDRVAEFLAPFGLSLEEQRNFGPETAQHGPPAGFAIAVVPPTSQRADLLFRN